ncbi:MAG: ATP-binding protein [Desulfuromonadaceae bacterium]|nr:ATP-binding protein [Desulfuromonadaceae bacterium]
MATSLPSCKEHPSRPARATILVVDDEVYIRDLCARALHNYQVFQAGSCEEAIRMYEKEHIDLVLSDITMPGGSGIDLLKRVKVFDPNAIVIIMTGFVDKESILNALKEDADDYINKPLNILQLRTSIEKALAKKALKEELASIKRSDDLKNAFLSLVSHKLRTPITGISLCLQNLGMGVFNPEDPFFAQNIAMANEEATYLGQLVADLLAFSQVMVNSNGLEKSSCDLNEIIVEVLFKCRELHCNFDVAIDFTPVDVPPVQLDASKIHFALMQIVDNAFKFSGKVGHVSIKLAHHGDAILLVISDSGIGIPAAELPKVFEKFYQIDPDHTGQVRGFGLGLFYARDFIRQHGGSISIASDPGLGTTVTISLPLQ